MSEQKDTAQDFFVMLKVMFILANEFGMSPQEIAALKLRKPELWRIYEAHERGETIDLQAIRSTPAP